MERVEKPNMNNTPNNYIIKESKEFLDDKLLVSETITNVNGIHLGKDCINNDKIEQYEICNTDYIKTEPLSEEVHNIICDNFKIEDNLVAVDDIKIEFNNKELFCDFCDEDYQDYCATCGMLAHILNRNAVTNIFNTTREELPKCFLEIRDSPGHLGVFALKVIPKDVIFGPFTGLNILETSLKIKEGTFVVSNDQLMFMNWMQHISSSGNIEHNLSVFQYEKNLYYRSSCEIQEGEELLVYFGEAYESSLNTGLEMDFIPAREMNFKNVFACTFCCLGFSAKHYLAEHKTICVNEDSEEFSIEELVQCQFCKIYLEKKEYSEYHMTYCSERNDRQFVLPIPETESKKHNWQQRKIYKCTKCKYKTSYKNSLERHANKHYEVKKYRCETCYESFINKESLDLHEEIHKFDEESSTAGNFVTDNEGNLQVNDLPREKRNQITCPQCEFQTKYKHYLKVHINAVHLNLVNVKCAICNYETNHETYLKRHMKIRHIKEIAYKCTDCEYNTYYKPYLLKHVRKRHPNETEYECNECEYKSKFKSDFEKHLKSKHRKKNSYKCMQCKYETDYKLFLKKHIKTHHPRESKYNCKLCEYITDYRSHLKKHVQAEHLDKANYKCMECEYKTYCNQYLEAHIKMKHQERIHKCMDCKYKTSNKAYLERHVQTKHVQTAYKCLECEYKTNDRRYLQLHMKRKHLEETIQN